MLNTRPISNYQNKMKPFQKQDLKNLNAENTEYISSENQIYTFYKNDEIHFYQ